MIIPMLCVTIFVILVVWFLLPRVAAGDGVGPWYDNNDAPGVCVRNVAFAALVADEGTGGGYIEGGLQSNGVPEHGVGVVGIREGQPLCVHATASVRRALDEGL